ncbi:MAG: 2-oxo acid dehydrogenase subunit E2 [Deltaproteobacteria bacterium]|nr:MAG: 2-oxo acid dehydrogenase subunit E2 [Deltaproteobacteria bacterium]RLC20948.1 MAG: 2-oxo acid dehydrogenase subunit E2 [Deltaproteobacteria bacterium]
MAIEIKIPKLGLTMEEAKLVKWSFNAGQAVAAEETVAVIETDKVSFEIVSPADGIIYPLASLGTMIQVSQVIGYVAADETELAVLQKEHPVESGAAAGQPEDQPEDQADHTVPAATKAAPPQSGGRIISSPLARRMAKEHGLDLANISGTGPGGRIIETDIHQALAAPKQAPPATSDSDPLLTVADEIPIQGIRKIIFKNMHLSLSTQAQLTLQTEASAKGMQTVRNCRNTILDPGETKISYNAIIIKAVAMALRQHPTMNASVDGDVINVWKQVHVGLAMDLGNGLIVPKIRNADTLSIMAIAKELGQLVEKAKQNSLLPDDLQGGTFTITNLGAWGVDHFTPIVNFPESAILGLGRIVEKPWVKNNEVVVDPRISLSLTFDHRIIDGAPGAMFLKTLTQMIEDPLLML